MRFISVLSIYMTTIFCSTAFTNVHGEWCAQLANVFIDENENAYILVKTTAYKYNKVAQVDFKSFRKENFTLQALQNSTDEMLKNDGSNIINHGGCISVFSNNTTSVIDPKDLTIYSVSFEPYDFIGYDYVEKPTLKCIVNKWPIKGKGVKFNDLAHVELTFESETDTEVNWKVIKMSRYYKNNVSDDEFKHFKVMTFKKAVYILSDHKVKDAAWELKAYKGEKVESNEINDVERINYNDTFIITFDELIKKKVTCITFKANSWLLEGELNIANVLSGIKEKKKKVNKNLG